MASVTRAQILRAVDPRDWETTVFGLRIKRSIQLDDFVKSLLLDEVVEFDVRLYEQLADSFQGRPITIQNLRKLL
ncbi:hypothetical protein [Microcystis phage Mae-JY22]